MMELKTLIKIGIFVLFWGFCCLFVFAVRISTGVHNNNTKMYHTINIIHKSLFQELAWII